MLWTSEKAAMAYMDGHISRFDWMKRFVKTNIFRVRFSWAPSEYCVTVTHVLRNLNLLVLMLHELTYRTT
jgi:hypothetical protein